jgi:hypothetical protein
MEPQKR